MRVPGFKRFFSLSLEASSSENSLERLKSLAKSFSSPWVKSCGDKGAGGKSLSDRVLSLSIETSSSLLEREDSSYGKPSKTGPGSSSLCGTDLIADSKFGYVKEFLFFLSMPLVFTAQK